MLLNEKSISFGCKILKHYPIGKSVHTCSSPSHECANHQRQKHQPFQHMHDYRKEREIYQKTTSEKMDNMRYFKQMGNNQFKDKNIHDAAYFYEKVIVYADYTFPSDEKQIGEMELLVQQANMNLAICLIKQNEWTKALVNLNEASKIGCKQNSQNNKKLALNTQKKAYYWLTKYYARETNFQAAKEQIKLLSQLPISSNQQITELTNELNDEISKYEKQTKDLSKKMFAINTEN